MAKIRIKSSLSVADTQVWIDGHRVSGITSISFERTADRNSEPKVHITLWADDLEVEGEVGEIRCG